MTVDSSFRNPRECDQPSYHPLVIILSALCLGIVLDRFLTIAFDVWLSVLIFALVVWLVAWTRKHDRLASCLLLLWMLSAGGAMHHYRWRLFLKNEIGLSVSVASEPICVEGTALTSPKIIPAPPPDPMQTFERGDQSQLELRVDRVRDGNTWITTSGNVQLHVEGQLLDVRAGDRIQVFGFARRPAEPMNPGEFDFAEYHRTFRRLCLLRANFPDCVRIVKQNSLWNPRSRIRQVRESGSELLWRYLSPSNASLASAILLGAREQIDQERTEDFLTSGTIHLLAISGLHVGILALGFLMFARFGIRWRRPTFLIAAAFVVFYAVLTDARPPVIRASLLIVLVCMARVIGRQAFSFNSLAAAACIVLMINPAYLFQTGTQLSFLAVITLACCAPLVTSRPIADPLDRLIYETRPWPVRVVRTVSVWFGQLWLAGFLIWLVALPLVAYRFHLISFGAVMVNPIVWIPIAVALFSGFGVLVFGWLFPPLGALLGKVCDSSLTFIEYCIAVVNSMNGSYVWTPGPNLGWVVATYILLGVFLIFRQYRPPTRWCIAAVAVWTTIGVFTAKPAQRQREVARQPQLNCTFVFVGHGTSVLLELPDGRTMLYDCGRLAGPSVAARSITSVLWSRGISHLDAVVLSHADADHYNALPELLRRISVGVVYVSPFMFENENPSLATLRRSVQDKGIPLVEIRANDRLKTRDDVVIAVLHPPHRGMIGSDNANSIVLLVEFAGRRILLPGDLEDNGMRALLADQPIDCDIVMAPHHGSVGSQPREFAAWSTPESVVVSGGASRMNPVFNRIFEKERIRVAHTALDGALRVSIHDNGVLTLRNWRHDRW
jgi:competence protein ComEC